MENSKLNVTTHLFDTIFHGEDMVTLHGLEKWTNHMYEILGWMTLANKYRSYDKVTSYINSIEKLIQAIGSRMEGTTPSERKDLEALTRKAVHLEEICDKLFNYQQISDNLCAKCVQVKKNSFRVDRKTGKATNVDGAELTVSNGPYDLSYEEMKAISELTKLGLNREEATTQIVSKRGQAGGAKKVSKKRSKKVSKKKSKMVGGSKKSSKKGSKKSKK